MTAQTRISIFMVGSVNNSQILVNTLPEYLAEIRRHRTDLKDIEADAGPQLKGIWELRKDCEDSGREVGWKDVLVTQRESRIYLGNAVPLHCRSG
jgi:hypothetical protein